MPKLLTKDEVFKRMKEVIKNEDFNNGDADLAQSEQEYVSDFLKEYRQLCIKHRMSLQIMYPSSQDGTDEISDTDPVMVVEWSENEDRSKIEQILAVGRGHGFFYPE